jgi:hypothetical protein
MDVIRELKSYYAGVGMTEQYNVPTVIRVSDSLGHVVHLSMANRHAQGFGMVDYSNDPSAYLRCGDSISIEVDVDPAFDPSEYDIRWGISNLSPHRSTAKNSC